jgi:dTDP-4-amino-4,6-dideoxygalactose transaminase
VKARDVRGAATPIHTADPRAAYLAHNAELDAAIQSALRQPHYVLGPVVEQFEHEFAAFVGSAHSVGVNSGTDALHLALRALGIGPGDEVITVAHTAVATVAAIELAGATPVLVDVELPWMTIDPEAAADAVGPRTAAVVAVHLYGQAADLAAVADLCDRCGLALIEDCAQAHGATWAGRHVGTFGRAGAFSFYPTKNLGTVGDGGMVTTEDRELAARIRMFRQYGWDESRSSVAAGVNSRLGPIEAAILSVKLQHLPRMLAARHAVAQRYGAGLVDLPLMLPAERPQAQHAHHLYVPRCGEVATRDSLLRGLERHGVVAGVHYPVPIHLQPAYRERVDRRSLVRTEELAGRVLSLPIYPELTSPQQELVITATREHFEGAR